MNSKNALFRSAVMAILFCTCLLSLPAFGETTILPGTIDGGTTGIADIQANDASFHSIAKSGTMDVGSSSFEVNSDGVSIFKSFTVATLPTAVTGGFIYVSDETGGATMAFSDGTNWRRVQDRAIVS